RRAREGRSTIEPPRSPLQVHRGRLHCRALSIETPEFARRPKPPRPTLPTAHRALIGTPPPADPTALDCEQHIQKGKTRSSWPITLYLFTTRRAGFCPSMCVFAPRPYLRASVRLFCSIFNWIFELLTYGLEKC